MPVRQSRRHVLINEQVIVTRKFLLFYCSIAIILILAFLAIGSKVCKLKSGGEQITEPPVFTQWNFLDEWPFAQPSERYPYVSRTKMILTNWEIGICEYYNIHGKLPVPNEFGGLYEAKDIWEIMTNEKKRTDGGAPNREYIATLAPVVEKFGFLDAWGTAINVEVRIANIQSKRITLGNLKRYVQVWSNGPNKKNDNGKADDVLRSSK